MARASIIILSLTTLLFVISAFAFALVAPSGPPVLAEPALADAQIPPLAYLSPEQLQTGLGDIDLFFLLLDPSRTATWALLGLACLGLLIYVFSLVRGYLQGQLARRSAPHLPASRDLLPAVSGPPTADSMARMFRGDDSFSEHGPLIIGLLAGAIWPWLGLSHLAAGFVLALIMAAGVLTSAMSGRRIGGHITQSRAMGFFAGWVTLVACTALAGLLQRLEVMNPSLAAALALICCAVLGVGIQLRIGGQVAYGLAIIWGLIAVAAATLTADAAIATVAALCIAIVAIGLVRVTT